MIIRVSILGRSFVNRLAYIKRLIQTLSITTGTQLGRAAQKMILPLLPDLLGRAA